MIGTRLVALILGLCLLTFGGYIFYEKAVLSVINGHTHERVGVVTNDDWSFWVSVSIYGVSGFGIFLAGAVFFFKALVCK